MAIQPTKQQHDLNNLTRKAYDLIAGRGISSGGLYSWQTVYNAFRDQGLSPERAKEETDKRVWIID